MLASAAVSRVETFGTANQAGDLDWHADDLEPRCDTTRFKVRRRGKPLHVDPRRDLGPDGISAKVRQVNTGEMTHRDAPK